MRIDVVVFDGFDELDVFGPLGVLAHAGYDVALVRAGGPGPVLSGHGVTVTAARALEPGADVVVVPGGGWLDRAETGTWGEVRRGALPEAVREVAAAGAVATSVCTGAFVLAAAGLLAGRPAVTNVRALGELADAGAVPVPEARVVDDGDVVTSGGLTAGIDLALWLVERFDGATRAREVARAVEHRRVGHVRQRVADVPPGPADAPDALGLPTTPLARAVLAAAQEAAEPWLLGHSVRAYVFARVAARARAWEPGRDYDDDLLFAACVLHDLGATPSADRGARFEVDGADAAVDLLVQHGVTPERAAVVWDAVALHTSPGIAERKQPEVALARAGITMDLGVDTHLVPEDLARRVHERWPRLDVARCLADALVAQAADRPAKAPAGSFVAELVRERATPPGGTAMERRAREGRWGS